MNYQEDLIKEKIGQIHEFCNKIMQNTYPYCRTGEVEIRLLAQQTNSEAYSIKCLVNQISGLLGS